MTRHRTARRGAILVGVVAALITLQLLVTALTLGGARDHDLTARRVESARSFYAAEAAMNVALRELSLGADEDGDGVVGGFWSHNPSAAPAIGDGGARGWATLSSGPSGTLCNAEGLSGQSTHRIECLIE